MNLICRAGPRAEVALGDQRAAARPITARTVAATLCGVRPNSSNNSRRGRGLAEAVDADHRVAAVLPPEVGHAGLDRDTRQAIGQHVALVRLRPGDRTRWSRASTRRARRSPCLGQQLARRERDADLGAGGDDHRTRLGGVAQHVGAAADRVDLPRPSATRRARPGARAATRPGRRCARARAAHASAVSTGSAGRQTSMIGISRSVAACSTDWWVGPSSPRPIESWVKTKIARWRISAAMRKRIARVVGEGQEGAGVGDEAAVQRDTVDDRRSCRTRARRS